jgi:proteasome lid subunit RPN8/RPN11
MSENGLGHATRHGLRYLARQLWDALHRSLLGARPHLPAPVESAPAAPVPYEPLRRLLLTDGVGRTLFEEFTAHRATARGSEETGWLLLGLRERDEAVALATLPAGTQRDAGYAHVLFDSAGQALGSRIVRQGNRRLAALGVVHTHPGSLRHPSEGDHEGDSRWVAQRRGGDGVFGIGTADADGEDDFARQPRPNVQVLGELCFSWYALAAGERRYRPLPVELTLGPDLARPLHDVWPTIEYHAERLDRLYRQQAKVVCEVVEDDGPALAVTLPLAENGRALHVLLRDRTARYFVHLDGQAFAVEPPGASIEQSVYLLLAELAARA